MKNEYQIKFNQVNMQTLFKQHRFIFFLHKFISRLVSMKVKTIGLLTTSSTGNEIQSILHRKDIFKNVGKKASVGWVVVFNFYTD